MKYAFLIAGAATLAFTASPAVAQSGNGKGNQAKHQRYDRDGRHDRDGRYDRRDGRRDGRYDRDDWRRYGRAGYACPPGLAKKNNGCLPPGLAKKRYDRGQRWRSNYYGTRYSYNQIPYDLRRQYDMNPNYRYYYSDGYYYGVNPRTMLIQQVISALIR